MKKLILIVFCLFVYCNVIADDLITPYDLGLKVKRGQIDYKQMTHLQKDTTVISLFTPEDNLLDIIVYYKSGNEIIVYRNAGNGYLNKLSILPVEREIKKISAKRPDDFPKFLQPRYDLEVKYKDGTEEVILNYKLNNPEKEQRVMVPPRNVFDDPRVFVYDLSFIEVWRSFQNGQPAYRTVVGDIDKDGINEVIQTFFPIAIPPLYKPTRNVVFEPYGNNMYRIDWDTILTEGGYIYLNPIADLDNDGNLEFFGSAYYFFINNLTTGLFECYGPGQYRFYAVTDFIQYASLRDCHLEENVKMGNDSGRGIWICHSDLDLPLPNKTKISLQMYIDQNEYQFSFLTYYPVGILDYPFTYDFDVNDIDRDEKKEILLGNTQFGTNYIDYMDSTGISQNSGYELKTIIPNLPLSLGYSLSKDMDNDGYKEFVTTGIGAGTGSIGVFKHTGSPGQLQYNVMWWDSTNIYAMPNLGIDSNSIDGYFTILYPTVSFNWYSSDHLITFSKNNVYSFFKSSYSFIDSSDNISSRLFDIDKDNKMNIIGDFGFGVPGDMTDHLVDYEQQGTIGIQTTGNKIPTELKLYQNFPNPFNGNSKIKFQVSKSAIISIKVFDIRGAEVTTILNTKLNPGEYETTFEGNNLSSGVYFYSLFANGKRIDTKKMLLIK